MAKLDMTPGAQIPRTDTGPQTAITQALSSVAYRDTEVTEFIESAQPDLQHKVGRFDLFRPNLGEAFSRAVLARTIGAGRKPIVPSFGVDPRMVVEHCLAAQELRDARDRRLTLVSVLTGVLFLPGALLWIAAFQLRAYLKRTNPNREQVYGGAVLLVLFGLAVLLAVRPPHWGIWAWYARVVMIVPVLGWYWARRICLRSAQDMRERWGALADGSVLAAVVPKAVPRNEQDQKATELRANLGRLSSEQDTNVLHYAGAKGILGLGRRWGSWQLAEDLHPAEGHDDFRTFHTWDLVRKIADRLNSLGRSEVGNGGVPNSTVQQWVVLEVGESADEIGRPEGPDMDGPRMRDFAVQNVANRQTFGNGPRHYLGTQFILHNGQLIVTLLVTVTALHNTLRIEVSGHALGPVAGIFTAKPKPKEISVQKTGKFWEERKIQLPLVDNDEVVRLAVRAPFMRAPGLLNWLGGSLKLPEPFGLRSAWASAPWGSRFMADDATRIATPVLSVVHAATMDFLEEHDIRVDRFTNRSMILKAEVQGTRPFKVDSMDA